MKYDEKWKLFLEILLKSGKIANSLTLLGVFTLFSLFNGVEVAASKTSFTINFELELTSNVL